MSKVLIIAGGKTGGHFFPGLAVAEEFKELVPEGKVYFFGTKGGIEEKIVPETPFELVTFEAKGFEGASITRKASSLLSLLSSVPKAAALIRKIKPLAVLGVGSYSSIPTCLAAYILKVPLFIHEQNSIPGLANRLLSKISRKVFLSFKRTYELVPKNKAILTGNPVRKTFLRDIEKAERNREPFSILFLGGSQGARGINRIAMLVSRILGGKCQIMHQTGERFYRMVKDEYKKLGVNAEIFPFSENIGVYFKRSHLVISRAGASTIFELSASRRTSLLVPFPLAARNHQLHNAFEMVETGGASMVEERNLTPELVVEEVEFLRKNPNIRKEREQLSGKLFKKDAQKKIIREILEC